MHLSSNTYLETILAIIKMTTVNEMYLLRWGEDDEAWKWRRRLLT